jgi:hypothetical protein
MRSFMCRRAALRILGAAVFSLALSPNVLASTVVVVTPPSTTPCKAVASYNTISQAVSSVPAGSVIYICPGTYAEQVVITKKLTLEGVAGNGATGVTASGPNNPVIVSPAGGVVVNSNDLYGYPGGQPTAAQILVQTPSMLWLHRLWSTSAISPWTAAITGLTVAPPTSSKSTIRTPHAP